jgi:hypothetical protein
VSRVVRAKTCASPVYDQQIFGRDIKLSGSEGMEEVKPLPVMNNVLDLVMGIAPIRVAL